MGNRKVQLVLQHCIAKMLHVLPPKNQTCLATNLVPASCVNTGFLLDKITRESHHTREFCHLLQNKFTLNEPVKRATCTDFVAKSRTTLLSATNFRNLQQPDLWQDRFECAYPLKLILLR